MMILRSKMEFRPDPGKYARRFAKVRSQAHKAGGDYWVSRILQRHFRPGAATRYGYRPRSPEYHKRKRRDARRGLYMAVPLVLTGETQNRATEPPVGVRGYPSRTTLRLSTPKYIYQQPPPNQPDMAAEIFALIPSEVRKIEQVEQRVAEKLLKQMKAPHTVTIG